MKVIKIIYQQNTFFIKKQAVVITGATGSGKSKVAIALAKTCNGIVINADASQIYQQVPILSAQPNALERQQTPHLLYGFRSIFESHNYSIGQYMKDLNKILSTIDDKVPIIVGGSMMYVEAIINGFNKIPDIDEKIKEEIRHDLINKTTKQLFETLQNIDDIYAKIVDANNPQRIARGIEVKLATGKSITYFWKQKKESILKEYSITKLITEMPRDMLYKRINNRFNDMMDNSALEEAGNIFDECRKKNINISTIPKIIGLNELVDYFNNNISLETAIEKAKQSTRNYAKRQLTWFRNRFLDFKKISPDNKEFIL